MFIALVCEYDYLAHRVLLYRYLTVKSIEDLTFFESFYIITGELGITIYLTLKKGGHTNAKTTKFSSNKPDVFIR
jgi:hypothetical protein